ncbi:MAG: Uma2 family endonuclease [Hyphomicrobiaceae bacterium]|nr:Uma2 family endonuclease [Hyphomicrobiaceae bacterium]
MSVIAKPSAKPPATYADLEAVPPNLVAEIIDGTLVTHPRPLPRHASATVALGSELYSPFQKGSGGPGGWIFMAEPELHLAEHVLVPDIAGWRRERLLKEPEGVGITIAPDWLCEVLSPSTASYDRTAKFRIYHEHRVGHLWYVDPQYRTLEVFAWSQPHWVPVANFGDFEQVTAPPFAELTFDLGALWPFDTPPAPPSAT